MKPHPVRDIVNKLIIANLTFIFILMLLGVSSAKQPGPPFSFPGGKRGQEAITALQGRLPEVASRYGKSAEKLKQIFLHDNDLWLDPAENLLYLCSFGVSEAESLPESAESAIPTGPFPLEQTFQLHSLAGASKVIYLDFDGHVTTGTSWNTYKSVANIVSVPYDFNDDTGSFSDTELSRIQNIWARVAEDFAIYNIDVTTEDPGIEALRRSPSGDEYYGIRVVISPSSSWYGSAGGVAYVGSFDSSIDTPTFVFSDNLGKGNEKYVTDAASHETGHTLGLSHDGTSSTAYYRGHGGWAPIMGVGYYQPITQWSKGEYAGANQTQDDLAVMLYNGATYRTDDHGDWIDNATMLSGDILDGSGIIERTGDMDVFGFQTQAGNISINIDPANLDPNLNILAQVIDDGGNIIGEEDEYYNLPASLNLNLPAGTYYILIDGVGTGDPDTGYTDYASLGQYFISGTLPVPQYPPDPPTGLSALPESSSQINLSWTDNSNIENGFSVERSSDNNSWIEVHSTLTNITTYADIGLNHNSTYYYRVSAYNGIGSSGYSNSASATTFNLPPTAPSGLSATAVSDSMIDLSWTDNSNNETGFAIERSPNGVNSWVEIATAADNTIIYSDTGLASGSPFFYRVSAYNQNGNSGFSNTASDTTAEVRPESPANLDAVASSYTQIDLSWQDISSNETGFKIERSDDVTPWSEIAALPSNSTVFSDSNVSSGITYYYRIFSYNSAGPSGYSNTAVATTDEPPQFIDQSATQEAAVAGTLSGTFVDAHANDSVLETIMERTSGGRPSKRYSYLEHKWIFPVQPGISVNFFANVWTDAAAQGDTIEFSYSTDDETYTPMFPVIADYDNDSYQTYALPGNFSGSVYIRVRDNIRTQGSYDKSTIYIDHLFIRIDNEPGTLPADPDGLTSTPVSSNAVELNWVDNADNELGFSVERSADGNGGWQQVGTAGSNITTHMDSGLDAATEYFYRVQTFNGTGSSDYSNVANATTLLQADNTMHIGALEGTSSVNRSRWDASVTITVVDRSGYPVTGATVEGSWSVGGSSTDVTDGNGRCTVSKTKIKTSLSSATFTVTNVSRSGDTYDPDSNVVDSIEVFRPN